MAVKYVKSKDIKIFPSGFRGKNSTGSASYDPASRLTNEYNLTSFTAKVASEHDSYVISFDKNGVDKTLIFRLKGYLFTIKLNSYLSSWSTNEMWAKIRLKPITNSSANNTTDDSTRLISPIGDETTILDNTDTEVSEDFFIGLELNDSEPTLQSGHLEYKLHLLTNISTNPQIQKTSLLKMSSYEIETASGENLEEKLITKTVIPHTTNTGTVGSSTKVFNKGYFKDLYAEKLHGELDDGSVVNDKLEHSSINIAGKEVSLGESITKDEIMISSNGLVEASGATTNQNYVARGIKDASASYNLGSSSTSVITERAVHFALPFLNSESVKVKGSDKIYAPATVGASNQYVKSTGSGAPSWQSPINNKTATAANTTNGDNLITGNTQFYALPQINDAKTYDSNSTFYTPITKGTQNDYLRSDGGSTPVWQTPIHKTSATVASTGSTLITASTLYYALPKINDVKTYNSNSTFYVPTAKGSSNDYLKSDGNSTPAWQSPINNVSATAAVISDTLITSSTLYHALPKINNAKTYKSDSTFYAPTSGGTSANYLKANGATSTPSWDSFKTLTIGTGLSGVRYIPNAATTISLKKIVVESSDTGALWYGGTTIEEGTFYYQNSSSYPSSGHTKKLKYGGYFFATNLYANRVDATDVYATTFYASSDKRLKTSIKDYNNTNSILDISIKEFDYIDSGIHTLGFIAQDLEKDFPELVSTDEKGYLTIAETKLVYLLMKEVKQLKEEISELKERI